MLIRLITPNQLILEESVTMVRLPGLCGELGILPHHQDMTVLLKEGVMQIENIDKMIKSYLIKGQFAKIYRNLCVIMVRTASLIENKKE